ncbi:hypothetical protein GCHA_3673 [Paraglaciecola chathamensis S18K6]|uniref:Uncharacterized protein n=1 Tax=Paraglaciecola chathamensis S18K6 TaxID=1127672 RepID=A0AAV3V3W8_9ALTE|nr:hypothetical protein GCHA_3673 [Paraglaciecola chathamensis S18K6]
MKSQLRCLSSLLYGKFQPLFYSLSFTHCIMSAFVLSTGY